MMRGFPRRGPNLTLTFDRVKFESDWAKTSSLYHVHKEKHYGHTHPFTNKQLYYYIPSIMHVPWHPDVLCCVHACVWDRHTLVSCSWWPRPLSFCNRRLRSCQTTPLQPNCNTMRDTFNILNSQDAIWDKNLNVIHFDTNFSITFSWLIAIITIPIVVICYTWLNKLNVFFYWSSGLHNVIKQALWNTCEDLYIFWKTRNFKIHSESQSPCLFQDLTLHSMTVPNFT